MSNALMFDRYRVIKKYREAGLTEDQAELYAEALVIAVEDQVATKQDVQAARNDLGKEIQAVRDDLGKEIQAVRDDLGKEIQAVRQEIAEVRSELKQDIAEVKTAIVEESRKTLFLMMGFLGGLMALFRFFS